MTFGEKIKKIREEKGISQRILGEKLGVKQQTIAQYEKAKNVPKYETLQKIANALEVSLLDFLDDEIIDALESGDEKIDEKINAIFNDNSLDELEKIRQVQELAITGEIVMKYHNNNAANGRKFLINSFFDMLNADGQEKAIDHVEMLTKIPEYQRKEKTD